MPCSVAPAAGPSPAARPDVSALHLDVDRGGAAAHEKQAVARPGAERVLQLRQRVHRLAVRLHDHIARLETGVVGGALLVDVEDEEARSRPETAALGLRVAEPPRLDAPLAHGSTARPFLRLAPAFGRALLDGDLDRALLAVAENRHRDGGAREGCADRRRQLARPVDRPVVPAHHDVAALDTGTIRRPVI